MRYCIVNLTRLGDLLQTQPVISALKASGHQVSLVCLDNFAAAAELLDGLDQVCVLPGAALLARSDQSWPLAVGLLRQWVEAEQEQWPADCVLNLTAGLSARLLSRLLLLPGKKLLGFGLDEFGFGINANPWATYVQAASSRRSCSPFNLVDGFRSMAECERVPPQAALKKPPQAVQEKVRQVLEAELKAALKKNSAEKISEEKISEEKISVAQISVAQISALSSFGISSSAGNCSGERISAKTSSAEKKTARKEAAGLVGFQLGASEDRRRWPTAHFADLAAELWEKYALVPVLLGSSGEKALATRYASHAKTPFIDRIGQSKLTELAASLLSCRLLITNDTGTMHMAAGLGLPVLALFFATAQAWDTGPYAEGLCCLEPRLSCHPCGFGESCTQNLVCRSSIAPATVAELVGNFLTLGRWQARPEALAWCRAWVSCRNGQNGEAWPENTKSQPDAHFFLDLKALPSLPLDDAAQQEAEQDRHAWLRWQRVFYRQLLDKLSAKNAVPAPAEQLGRDQSQPENTVQPAPFAFLKTRFPLSVCKTARICADIAQFCAFLELLTQQINLLQKALPPALLSRSQASFLGTCQKASSFLEQSIEFTPLYYLWQTMLQDKGANLADLAQFLLTLHEQLELFAQACSSSPAQYMA